jgi:hypothetical protein
MTIWRILRSAVIAIIRTVRATDLGLRDLSPLKAFCYALGEVIDIHGDTKAIFREMLCSGCNKPLRGYFYYECDAGCWKESVNVHLT